MPVRARSTRCAQTRRACHRRTGRFATAIMGGKRIEVATLPGHPEQVRTSPEGSAVATGGSRGLGDSTAWLPDLTPPGSGALLGHVFSFYEPVQLGVVGGIELRKNPLALL